MVNEIQHSIEIIRNKFTFKTNTSAILLFLHILFVVLFIDLVLVLIIYLINFVDTDRWLLPGFSLEENFVLLFLLIHLILFVWIFINWYFKYFIIKNWKIIRYSWVFFKKKEIFLIHDITSMNLSQNIFGRIFNYWDIILFFNNKVFVLKNIPYPENFIDYIEFYKDNLLFTH